MKVLFLISFFLISSAHARLEKLDITDLFLNYANQYGEGHFKKLNIGIKSQTPTYPIEISKLPDSFLIDTPFISLEWLEPLDFLHNAQEIHAEALHLNLGKTNHSAAGESLSIKTERGSRFKLEKFTLSCSGQSELNDVLERMKEDCFQNAQLKTKKIDLPFGFDSFLKQLTENASSIDTSNVLLKINQQKFNLSMSVRYVISSTLRANGKIELQDEDKTLAIRLDSAKFGFIPVTAIIFSELRRNESANLKIDPPWIKVRL